MRSKERMPREESLQRRKKPHREDKSSTEADDEAQPRENKAQTIVAYQVWDLNPKEQEPIAKGNPSNVIKSVCKTHLTQRVTPSRRNTNETNRLSLRSVRVGEPTTDTRPRQG